MKPMIQLSDGAAFDFTCPTVPSIEVLASSLAKICRFVGHTRGFYSVAQHSVYVSQLVPTEYALAALLHDASEAVMGDCSSPLKKRLPDFQSLEWVIQARIYERYVPGFNHDSRGHAAVHTADLAMLAAERRDLMPKDDPGGVWGAMAPAERRVVCAPWQTAEAMFLERYKELAK